MIFGVLDIGLIYGLMALGVFLSFRVLNFADLTVDASFTTGAAVCALFITRGYSPWLATIAAFFAGMAAGLITGILHTKGKIDPLLAGILTQIGLYSVNLRILGQSLVNGQTTVGRGNVTLPRDGTLLSQLRAENNLATPTSALIFAVVVVVFILFYDWFLSTDIGLAMQATGDNEQIARAQGVSTDAMKNLGLSLSNGMVALSGALFAQYNGYADIGMGTGLIVAGLASVILGQAIFGQRNIYVSTFAVVAGSFIYRLVIQLALQAGFDPNDMKLISAVLVVLALLLPRLNFFKAYRARRRDRQLVADRALEEAAISNGRGILFFSGTNQKQAEVEQQAYESKDLTEASEANVSNPKGLPEDPITGVANA